MNGEIKYMNYTSFLYALLLVSLLFSCSEPIDQEGFVQVEGGKIWYKIEGGGDKTPLLIMHGGPGSRSCAMMPGYKLLSNERPVIFYDQLGSGNSDRPSDTSLWRIERFVDEIDLLRKALHLDKVHILGQSCGSTFLMEYLATKSPNGVQSVIFSSPMLSTEKWISDAKYLLGEMPENLQDTIAKYEQLMEYDAPSYLAATDSFYVRHLTRKGLPYGLNKECNNVGGFNVEVYNHMWGPTEFTATGTLINFDRTADLKNIEAPVLFITGEYDEARPETIYEFQAMTRNSEVAVVPDAAHMTMIDNPDYVKKVIGEFLSLVESQR
jgi:proline iminopeptidase